MNITFNRRDFLRLSSAAMAGTLAWANYPLLAARANAGAALAYAPVLQAIDELINSPWTRKHDLPGTPLIPQAQKILYPKSLEDLIAICSHRVPAENLKAAGSHWALSEAAVSDNVFVETHDPNNVYPAMDRTLYDVVPNCLTSGFLQHMSAVDPIPFDSDPDHVNKSRGTDLRQGTYLVHIETGKRIYQLYSELDLGDDQNAGSLALKLQSEYGNAGYLGSWAFETLGGAGGQTVFGALTTGTHGGDIYLPPLADSVVALHLVADGGKHYWIEPQSSWFGDDDVLMTDDAALTALYGAERYGGLYNFEIIRNDDIFNAVLVSAGRFGIVYSVVLRAVRQYSLREERRLGNWQDIKSEVFDTTGALYTQAYVDVVTGKQYVQRFLQIAVCLTPHDGFHSNLCGITRRWNVPMALNPGTQVPSGRAERRGVVMENAGNSYPYLPDPDKPNLALQPSFLERACSNADFVVGLLDTIVVEIKEFIDNHKVAVGGALAAVVAIGGPGLVALPLATILLALLAFLAILRAKAGPRLGGTLNELRDQLLNRSNPAEKAAGLLVWQMVAYKLFQSQQGKLDFEAISYAVMDTHDYKDMSCNVNVDSIEVFFDAADSTRRLTAFVDALIDYEIKQEFLGKAIVGYVSLRFTGRTRALIGMQRHDVTCAVEVAGLKDVEGTTELIDYAIALSRDKNIGGILHWGQRNPSTKADIDYRFGADIEKWRSALARITVDNYSQGFSSDFTRRLGLEPYIPIPVAAAATELPSGSNPVPLQKG